MVDPSPIPATIQVVLEMNRKCLLNGEPPIGLCAVHAGSGLPDDAVLLDSPVLAWAKDQSITVPDKWTYGTRRIFHLACMKVIEAWVRANPPTPR